MISLVRKCNERLFKNIVSFSIQHVRLPTQRLPIVLLDLQFVKINAIDAADIDGADDRVIPSRLVDSEDTTSSAESVPGRRLFRFIVAAIVPHILFTLDFYCVLLWVEKEVSVLYNRVLSDNPFRWFEEMTYLSAYSAVAMNYFDLVEWFTLQGERDFSAVTASRIHFLRRIHIGWFRNVWRSIDRLHCSTIVDIDLQWLGVEILQGADLRFFVNKASMGTTT